MDDTLDEEFVWWWEDAGGRIVAAATQAENARAGGGLLGEREDAGEVTRTDGDVGSYGG